MLVKIHGSILILLTFTLLDTARAEDGPGEPGAVAVELVAREEVVPPSLVDFVPAVLPEGAPSRAVSVNLQLTIGTDGSVKDAVVVSASDPIFDDAALNVARACKFAPALRGSVPVLAKIRFEYTFAAAEPRTPEVTNSGSNPITSPRSRKSEVLPRRERPSPEMEITVRGDSTITRFKESAQAVKVIDTTSDQRMSAELGEVLARSEGVGVRRSGGLGSDERISLAGLTDDQIRFAVDGIPIEFGGYGRNLSGIPLNFVERVEVYQGVVPIRFGADALGGAINVVTDGRIDGTRAALSQEIGSFGTIRTTLGASHLDRVKSIYARANVFIDSARNDYPIEVDVADRTGALTPTWVRRFHDRYGARGVGFEFSVVRRPWARRLALRVFASEFEKEIQPTSS